MTEPTRLPADDRNPLPSGDSEASRVILERLAAHAGRRSRYRVEGEVARGGMGVILRVWDEDLRRELAMKTVLGQEGPAKYETLPPKLLGRFLEEAQVTGQLDHPGIVPVHELGLDERNQVFFTMRLVKGRDLKEIFERVKAGDAEWSLTRALWVMLKVCDAMAYAHAKGVIHRDLKPANVMVGRFGEVYVMDWGLARVIGRPEIHDLRLRKERPASRHSMVESERRLEASHSADSLLYTMDGDVVGTPAFMSPEQARGQIEQLGPRSDVYSVGAMLYQLLSGEMPYVDPQARVSQHIVLRWVLEGPPMPVHELAREVPAELIAIVEKAMARDPARRYEDMGALADDLRAYLENRVVSAYRTGAWTEFRKWVRRNRPLALAWGVAGSAALAGLLATALVQAHGRQAADQARALAEDNEKQARHLEAVARAERANVLRLSAFQELEDLTHEADRLWPVLGGIEAACTDWLGRAERLVAGLDQAPGDGLGHRAQLEALRARAQQPTASALADDDPRVVELANARARRDALRRARAVRTGLQRVQEPELDPATLLRAPGDLNELAWSLVDPARTSFGGEARGLALARLAVERSSDAERPRILDTLAWALVANGLDAEALEISRAALEETPEEIRLPFEEYLDSVVRAIEFASGPRGEAQLAEAEQRCEQLEASLPGSARLSFASDEDRWWYGQLLKLVQALERLADPRLGLIAGIDPEHGWGVRRRLELAQTLAQSTLGSTQAREQWTLARAAIRQLGAYRGLELAPQPGLVPLGPDPDSGLWEFADLQLGSAPRRDERGQLVLEPGMGVVFVLLPGGPFALGAQPDPLGPNYDPQALPAEGPVQELQLDPFLLSKYELTQGQWRRLSGQNPSLYLSGTVRAGNELDDLSPVEQISWDEAGQALARLGWVLPTEAQWEYGARGGIEAPWWTGDDPASLQGAANLSDDFARANGAPWKNFEPGLDDGVLLHARVGGYAPNPFGLHDVLGNVWEWCRDGYLPSYELARAPGDGLAPAGEVSLRVLRGGSFVSDARGVRSARRDAVTPELRNEAIGVRPARALARE